MAYLRGSGALVQPSANQAHIYLGRPGGQTRSKEYAWERGTSLEQTGSLASELAWPTHGCLAAAVAAGQRRSRLGQASGSGLICHGLISQNVKTERKSRLAFKFKLGGQRRSHCLWER